MPLPVYLAMTAAQFQQPERLPSHPAWMACHFSCYGTGLSNCPETLPDNTLLILNDRTPVWDHDPKVIVSQLRQITERNKVPGILLDFQRQGFSQTATIAKAIAEGLSCPVAVTESYAADLDCPVFLSPPPLHRPLKAYLEPWNGREIWLEAALDCQQMTVTEEGCIITPVSPCTPPDTGFTDNNLFCMYEIKVNEDEITFTLYRTPETLKALLNDAEKLGVSMAVGLYQELGKYSV